MAGTARAGKRRPLKRRVATRRPRKTVVVFCEGTRTEPEYLRALKLQPIVRDVAAVDLRVEKTGTNRPLRLVSHACAERTKAIEEDAEIDEFWCVFDVEWPINHPDLNEAITLAGRGSIMLAISNPCFELWLILHLDNHGAWMDNQSACQLRARLDGSDGKSLDADIYMPRVADAARRAAGLDDRHIRDKTRFPHNNPSSGMHRLFSSVTSV